MNSFKELYESLDVDTVVSIKITKEQIDYCYSAETFDEFLKRYNKLIDNCIAEITEKLIEKNIDKISLQIKKSAQYTFYADDYAQCKCKLSSIYGKTAINKKYHIAQRG